VRDKREGKREVRVYERGSHFALWPRKSASRPCASRVRERSRAHAAAPAHIRIVMATFPVVCRARRDLAARRT